MNTTIEAPQGQKSFRAGVNESGLFKTIQHIFSSSFTVLAELMQNSRRAGASYVDFVFDPVAKSLTITDNGSGISDFSKLVQLCESGWDDDVKIADNPFGMGFFAAFFAADELVIKSNGAGFSLTLNDIQSKRELLAKPDATAPVQGTSITLKGLKEKLLAGKYVNSSKELTDPTTYALHQKIVEFARGFAIDVRFNGESLPRPHAQANRQGKQNQYGFFSCGHIHDSRDVNFMPNVSSGMWNNTTPALYLQGLPIQVSNHESALAVVHLDTHLFTPVVPDRTHLFDSHEKLEIIRKEILQIGKDFLAERKNTLAPEQFATLYWAECGEYAAKHLLNDIPLIPSAKFHTIDSVSEVTNDMWTSISHKKHFVTLQEIKDGTFKVWTNEPDGVKYYPGHGAILKVIQRNEIAVVTASDFDAGHWIHTYALDCNELVCTLEIAPVQKTHTGYFANSEVCIQFVDWVKVTLSSKVVPDFVHVEVIDNDWIMDAMLDDAVADSGIEVEIHTDSEDVVCYVMPKDDSSDDALDAIASWEDNYGYNESWRDREVAEWNALISSMRGQSLAQVVSGHIRDISVTVTQEMVGQMMLVAAVQDGNQKDWRRLQAIDLEVDAKWAAFHIASQNAELDPQGLKQLFFSTFKSE